MFALHDGVHTPLAVAIIGGFGWGFIILNLDRFLVLSMGHARDWKRLLLMALPRLALAAVISIVVATPMTLRIFASDISNEMVQLNATESKQVAAQQLASGPATQAAALLVKINTDKQILAGHLQGTVSNPEETFWQGKVDTLTPQVQAAQTAMDKAQTAYQCELDGSGPGCEGASDLQGAGPMAALKKTEFVQAQQKYDTLNGQLQSAQQQLTKAQSAAEKSSGQTLQQQQSTAKAELPGLEKQFSALENQLQTNEAKAQGAVDSNNGILAQLQDLSTAGAKNPVLSTAQWIVTLLFFCIEILPVAVKFLLNMGPLTTYETLLKNEEDIITDSAKLRRVSKRRDAQREADKQDAIDKHMSELEEDLGKRANEHVAKHMEAILDVALKEWSRQVQAKIGGTGAPGGPPGRRVTGSQPRLSITSPQPTLGTAGAQPPVNGGYPGPSYTGTNGNAPGGNGIGQAPTVTYLTQPGGGYALPDDDGDLL